MAIAYPTVHPSSRRFIEAEFAVTEPSWLDMVDSRRLWSSIAFDGVLDLGYELLSNAESALILAAWFDSRSGFHPLTLPNETVCGITSATLQARIQSPEGLEWRFAEKPRHTRIGNRMGNMSVMLVATLPNPLNPALPSALPVGSEPALSWTDNLVGMPGPCGFSGGE